MADTSPPAPAPAPAPELGIILAAHGTARSSAARTLAGFVEQVRSAHPQAMVVSAYTSHMVHQRLRHAQQTDAPPALPVPEALAQLADAGVRRVALQSLHTAAGREFAQAVEAAAAWQAGPRHFAALELGAPLLAAPEDIPRVATAALAAIPPERRPGDGVVLVGHGISSAAPGDSQGLGQALYGELASELASHDPLFLVGLLEGSGPAAEEVAAQLLAKGVRRAWLLPFLAVPGYHVCEDIAGERPTSWASRLAAAGVEPQPLACGLTQMDSFAALWLARLAEAVARASA